jgi:hypothetical protein
MTTTIPSAPRGFRDASTIRHLQFVTERGDVLIRQPTYHHPWTLPKREIPKDWLVLPMGGAMRWAAGVDEAAAEARWLAKTSAEWRLGDLAGESSAYRAWERIGESSAGAELRDLRAELRREIRVGTAKDFDRGYVVGYERGIRGAKLGKRSVTALVDSDFEIDQSLGRSYLPPGHVHSPPKRKTPRQIMQEIEEILGSRPGSASARSSARLAQRR